MSRFLPLVGAALILAAPAAALAQQPTPAPRPAPATRPVSPAPAARPVLPAEPTAWTELTEVLTEARYEMEEARWALDAARVELTAPLALAHAELAHLEAPLALAHAELAHLEAPLALAHAELAHGAAPLAATMAELVLLGMPGAPGPQPGWAPSDPADSLYRIARETLNRSEYRRAAQLFNEMRTRHPKSAYVSEAAYWEAFALYRIGSTDDLRSALRVLDQQGSYPRKETEASAAALRARVLGALAQRGDASAQQRVAQAARSGSAACDPEDLMVRVEALNALSQLDRAAAVPLLRRVLARRDDCSAALRRSAVMLIAREDGPETFALLGDVAARDPNGSVRSIAVAHIGNSKSDDAARVLEQMLRADDDQVQRAAARTLARRGDARSRRAVRTYIEASQTGESQRAEAILNFTRESATADDVAFLRTLFSRTDSDRVRSAIISVLPRLAPEDGRQWLLGIARDGNQPTGSRSLAIAVLSRDSTLAFGELARMYDAANERRIREQVVAALGRRPEPEATEKLIDIARHGTDPVVRNSAITQLSRKKDPRLKGILQELIDG